MSSSSLFWTKSLHDNVFGSSPEPIDMKRKEEANEREPLGQKRFSASREQKAFLQILNENDFARSI